MIYSNDDPMALYAMEAERTADYGSGYYDDEECIGCTECVYKTDELF